MCTRGGGGFKCTTIRRALRFRCGSRFGSAASSSAGVTNDDQTCITHCDVVRGLLGRTTHGPLALGVLAGVLAGVFARLASAACRKWEMDLMHTTLTLTPYGVSKVYLDRFLG